MAALQEQHVQIVRKGSEKLRVNARVVVVSYDLVAAHDGFFTGELREDVWSEEGLEVLMMFGKALF